MVFLTEIILILEHLLEVGGLDPDKLAERFCGGRIFGIGSTVRGFIKNYRAGTPWYEAGSKSAGNGALMRIAPILIPHLKTPSRKL
jgi:ADP-ribosylglycohydrolase